MVEESSRPLVAIGQVRKLRESGSSGGAFYVSMKSGKNLNCGSNAEKSKECR
jgi:hypothetical protein